MRLFDISSEFAELYNLCEDIEFDEDGNIVDNSDLLSKLFNELESELSDKLENTAYIIKELKSSEDALKLESKRLADKAKILSNRQERLRQIMKLAIESSGQQKIKTDKFSFSVTNRESFNYDDVSMFGLDKEFIKEKQELNKTKIKEFVKAGGSIDGVKIETKSSLTIR